MGITGSQEGPFLCIFFSVMLFWIYASVTQQVKYLTVVTKQSEILNSMLIWIFWLYFRWCLAVINKNKSFIYYSSWKRILTYSLSEDIRIYMLCVRFILQMSIIHFCLQEKLVEDVNGVNLDKSTTTHSSFKDWMRFLSNFVNSPCFIKHKSCCHSDLLSTEWNSHMLLLFFLV